MNKAQKAAQAKLDGKTKDFVYPKYPWGNYSPDEGIRNEDDVFRETINLRQATQCCATCNYGSMGWNGSNACMFIRPKGGRGYFLIRPNDVCDHWKGKAGQSVLFEGMHA